VLLSSASPVFAVGLQRKQFLSLSIQASPETAGLFVVYWPVRVLVKGRLALAHYLVMSLLHTAE